MIPDTILDIENDLNFLLNSHRRKTKFVNIKYVTKILCPGPRTWPFWLPWQIHFDFPDGFLRICKPDDIQISDYFTIPIYLDSILPKQNVVCILAANVRYLQRDNFLTRKLCPDFLWSCYFAVLEYGNLAYGLYVNPEYF